MSASPDRILSFVAAAERTALAWERTGFGFVGIGAVLVHDSRANSGAFQLALGIAVMASGALTSVLLAPSRYRTIMRRVSGGSTPLHHRMPALLALTVVLVSATSVVMLRP